MTTTSRGAAARGRESLVARARSRRRRARAAGAAVLALLTAAVAAGGWWAWRSGMVDVQTVEVLGATRSGEAAVLEQVGPVVGEPLPFVDTAGAQRRIGELPLVLQVDITRRWPRTLVVEVTERRPVAAVPVDGGYALLDDEAVSVGTVPEPPDGLPVVRVDPAAGPGPLGAARAVAEALPPDLAERTREVSAASIADVRLVVDADPASGPDDDPSSDPAGESDAGKPDAGREVRWGAAGDDAAKAEVLLMLLATVDARVYDVSAPGAPATSP